MFDQFKNLSGMASLMKNSGAIQEEFKELHAEMERARIDAETGGGAVRAVVTGTMRLISIHVDPAMMAVLVNPDNEEDRHLAEDLIAGAVNAALEKAKTFAAEEAQNRAQNMGLPIPPGMDLSNLLGG